MVKGLYRVTQIIGKAVNVFNVAYHGETVTYLQRKVRASEQVKASTVHACNINFEAHTKS